MKLLLPTGILTVITFCLIQSMIAQGICTEFGVNGIAQSLESHSTHLNALTVLANGKIVAVGYYDLGGSKDMLVARYNANGTPDLTFSSTGIQIYDVSDQDNDEALCVAVASDGNILVGGISAGYGTIIKLDAAGKLVSSFGSGGKVKDNIIYSSVEDIIVSPAGTIFGVGKTFHTENIVLRRLNVHAYNSNGSLLTSFSEDGKYDRSDFLIWHTTVVKGAMQSDGKLVVGGTMPGVSNTLDNWFLARLNIDGTNDNTFHADGLVEDPESATSHLTDLAIGTDGSIYAGGFASLNSDFLTSAVVKKFKSNGDSDNSFNMTGSAVHPGTGNGAMLYALAIDENEKVYLVGSNGTETNNQDLLIAAFNADGEHDPDFTFTDKIANTNHGALLDMVRLSDGSFVACGYAEGKDRSYGILRKYNPNGELETSFNESGQNFIRYATDGETRTVAVQGDGKILAAGVYLEKGSNTGIAIARFESNGSPDLSFGTYGYLRFDISERREFVHDLYVYPDGKILLAGVTNDPVSSDDFLIIKLNSDGSLDESFGTDGYVKKHVGAYAKHNDVNGITVDLQGRIVIAGDGNYNGGSYQDATIMRLLPDGTTDLDFAQNGVFSIGLTVVNDYFRDVVVAEDGSIYAVGHGTVNVGGAVVKLNDAGELDTDFGTDGVFYTDWKDGYISYAYEIELQEDDKILVGCSHEPEDGTPIKNSYVYRLLPSGDADNTFGENGIVEFHFSTEREIYGLEIDKRGLIYFAASGDNVFHLAKIDEEGQVVGDLVRIEDLTSRAGGEINKINGNVYAGANISGSLRLTVACIESSAVEQPDCTGMDKPTITIQDEVLYSSEADSYQWYSSGALMEGETGRSLGINLVEGDIYSVEVSIGECSAFSDEFEYVITGNLHKENFKLRVYPNPTRENFMIESQTKLQATTFLLHSVEGKQVVGRTALNHKKSAVTLDHLPAGLYILSVESPDGVQKIKILKQN